MAYVRLGVYTHAISTNLRIHHECESRIKNLSRGSPFGITRLAEGRIFSSPEPKAHGEIIVWDSSRRPCVRPSVRPHFQT